MAEDDFSWNDSEKVVVEQVNAIAVYTNPKGNIVVRQQGSSGEDDQFIRIPRHAVDSVIAALRNETHTKPPLVRAMVQGDGGGSPINP